MVNQYLVGASSDEVSCGTYTYEPNFGLNWAARRCPRGCWTKVPMGVYVCASLSLDLICYARIINMGHRRKGGRMRVPR